MQVPRDGRITGAKHCVVPEGLDLEAQPTRHFRAGLWILTSLPGLTAGRRGSHADSLNFLPGEPPGLAPISVDPDPAPTARNPSAGHPDGARPGRRRPASRHPDVPSSVPAVVSGYPYPTRMQCPSRSFQDNGRGRPDTNDDLRACRADTQRDPAQRGQQTSLDGHQITLRNCLRAKTAYPKSPILIRNYGIRNYGHNPVTIPVERQAKAYHQLTDVVSERPQWW